VDLAEEGFFASKDARLELAAVLARTASGPDLPGTRLLQIRKGGVVGMGGNLGSLAAGDPRGDTRGRFYGCKMLTETG
jgi:hypothetical protein